MLQQHPIAEAATSMAPSMHPPPPPHRSNLVEAAAAAAANAAADADDGADLDRPCPRSSPIDSLSTAQHSSSSSLSWLLVSARLMRRFTSIRSCWRRSLTLHSGTCTNCTHLANTVQLPNSRASHPNAEGELTWGENRVRPLPPLLHHYLPTRSKPSPHGKKDGPCRRRRVPQDPPQ